MEAKSNRHPLRFVSIQADAAAQTAFMLPMQSPVTHAPTGKELVCLMPFLKFLWYFSIFLPDLRKKCVCFFLVFVSVGIVKLFRKNNYHRLFAHY